MERAFLGFKEKVVVFDLL
jgi:hypothetical protein